MEYDTVVVIAPSHTVFFQGASVYNGGAYQTPIGVVPIDMALLQSDFPDKSVGLPFQ
jgi:AmmeMemoRadiSam system protein B